LKLYLLELAADRTAKIQMLVHDDGSQCVPAAESGVESRIPSTKLEVLQKE
jgi:hypothetical protein